LRYLLDVNFLIALLMGSHVHNDRAHKWWRDHMRHGWASCPITQNGFVRIVSQPTFAARIIVADALSVLADAARDSDHEFWADDVSVLDKASFDHNRLLRSDGITDAYLLALAVKREGCLVTFDKSIPLNAVKGAEPRHIFVAD
jgi:uncharacterized protein